MQSLGQESRPTHSLSRDIGGQRDSGDGGEESLSSFKDESWDLYDNKQTKPHDINIT